MALRSNTQARIHSTFFRLAADAVVTVHIGFVFFVLLGGLLVLRWPRLVWLHVPAAVWGIVVEYGDRVCPLTAVENYLRLRGGTAAYQDDFIEHYIVPLLYPARLTRRAQVLFGSLAIAVNLMIYWRVVRRK